MLGVLVGVGRFGLRVPLTEAPCVGDTVPEKLGVPVVVIVTVGVSVEEAVIVAVTLTVPLRVPVAVFVTEGVPVAVALTDSAAV
jgi:hypothetical protein